EYGIRDDLVTGVQTCALPIWLKVHVMLAISNPAAMAAKQGTQTIPIVFIAGDPFGSGLVASLARPGGNVTGLSLALGEEFPGKRSEERRVGRSSSLCVRRVMW